MRNVRMSGAVLLGFLLFLGAAPSARAQEVTIDLDASSETVVSGSNITFTVTVTNEGSAAAAPFTMVNELPSESTFVSCEASAGGLCAASGTTVSASFVTLGAESSAVMTIVATVNCALGNDSDIFSTAEIHSSVPDPDPEADEVENETLFVTVLNPAPVIKNVSANPSMLWPPNHKWVDVTVDYEIEDNCGPVVVTLSVTSNEPVNGTGDGDTEPDWEIVSDHLVRLRAERAGTGSGRIYTITITATDSAGQSSSATVDVTVPHSRR